MEGVITVVSEGPCPGSGFANVVNSPTVETPTTTAVPSPSNVNDKPVIPDLPPGLRPLPLPLPFPVTGDCGSISCEVKKAPVCGTDGITYANECLLNMAACYDATVSKSIDGACPKKDSEIFPPSTGDCDKGPCPRTYFPICASDGKTYANLCEFQNERSCKSLESPLRMIRYGACDTVTTVGDIPLPAEEPKIEKKCLSKIECQAAVEPVCGTDGNTYPNRCLLSIANCEDPTVTLAHEGLCLLNEPKRLQTACDEKVECDPEVDQPVCGTDGVTYANACYLFLSTCRDPLVSKATDEPCVSSGRDTNEAPIIDGTSPICERIKCDNTTFEPVCASNGITYKNSCMFLLAGKCKNKVIETLHDGFCKKNELPECGSLVCPAYFVAGPEQVCGTDGVTYTSSCDLLVVNACPGDAPEPKQAALDYEGPCYTAPPPTLPDLRRRKPQDDQASFEDSAEGQPEQQFDGGEFLSPVEGGESPSPTDGEIPSPSDWESPAPTDWENPSPTDWENPSPSDWENPSPTDWENPSPTDWENPSPSDWENPSPTDWENPSPTDWENPSPTDWENPSPTDWENPSPTDWENPSPSDWENPSPTDWENPSPTDWENPS
ncbi:hypothetical protein HDU67_008247, partial [Dinochytrium kinnereticum]